MTSWGSAAVPFDGVRGPAALVAPMPVERVFTRAERLHSGKGRTLQHWAGRLAAKYAVLQLLTVQADERSLGEVEILPRPSPICGRGAACLNGHPPAVQLRGTLWTRVRPERRVGVSISHAASLAVAVALESARLPGDGDPTCEGDPTCDEEGVLR